MEGELPLMTLNFRNPNEAKALLDAVDNSMDDVIWEARSLENGTYSVSILSVKSLEDKQEEEAIDDGKN